MVGIFPRLSGIIGLHHYTYYQGKDMSTVDTPKLVDSTIEFAKAVGIHF
jgi:hypothetical protein